MIKKSVLTVAVLLFTSALWAQTEKYPVFENCETTGISDMQSCFKTELRSAIINSFKIPEKLKNEGYQGQVNVVFVVDSEGLFKVIYVNSPYPELKAEAERVFEELPKVIPAKFNNHAIEMRFVFPLKIPLNSNLPEEISEKEAPVLVENTEKKKKQIPKNSLFPEHQSELNIPFVHTVYNGFEYAIHKNENTHTAMKPYLYSEVVPFANLEEQKKKLMQPKSSWFGRKLFNEHMAYVKGDNYWFTINPVVDLQVGRDNEDISTFNNTRAVQINGGLGRKFNFSTSFYESQGRFADYVNRYARSIRPDGGNPAIIPGRGIAKEFKTDAFDYPIAEAYLSYTPNKNFNFQFGSGKNFIGDGYRSLVLSDVASPYPYFKINTNFWKIKYTNLWMWMQDVRKDLTEDGAFGQKFVAIHYLSWNVSKKLNLGFFETVIWDNVNNRGFDINYLNPIIFYTATEFATGTRAGNALLGLTAKYKTKNISWYSQLLIDEFRVSEMTNSDGWWGNKFGVQFGLKYFNAFNIENLFLQAEYNAIRPYTFSHDELNYNFGHNNQPLAHLWGSNFKEFIGILNYSKNRWYTNAKFVFGKKGFDFTGAANDGSYGGDIYADNDLRVAEYGNEIGQGNKASIFVGDLQVGYIVNPTTNLKLFAGATFRNFNPQAPNNVFDDTNSTWISIGLKTDVFNWYFDF